MQAIDSTGGAGCAVADATVRMRMPCVADGAAIWRLVRDAGSLDLNSPYAYLLVASHFAETGIVADCAGKLLGFVAAYRPPGRGDALFVWQVGVTPAARGSGLAGRMLDAAVDAAAGVRWLEATVTPSNAASDALFRGFARRRGVACAVGPGFASTDFPETAPGQGHEAELLYRIGPLDPVSAATRETQE